MGSFVDFDEVRATYPILDVATRLLGAELKAEGENKYRGPCPFCSDKRSFVITTNAGNHGNGMAGCFKCGPKGDSISLVAKKFGIKANEAAAKIVEQLGTSKVTSSNVTLPTVPDDKLEKVAARLLHEHEDVQALGLTPEMAKALSIGYIKSGILAGRVLFPLYKENSLTGFVGYSPDTGLKFPPNIVEAPSTIVRLVPKTG